MIGKEDLETLDINEEFNDCLKSTNRYIRSKLTIKEHAEDLTQETVFRVMRNLQEDKIPSVNIGYFLRVAGYVLKEYYRGITKDKNKFTSNDEDDEFAGNILPIDAEAQLVFYDDAKDRGIINECFLECFEEQSIDNQELLWRYSFNEKEHKMDLDEPSAYTNFFGSLLDSIHEIRDKFMSLQDDHMPLTKDARVKISRLRKKLRVCLTDCVSRKKLISETKGL